VTANSNTYKKWAVAGLALIVAYVIFTQLKKVDLKAAVNNTPPNFPTNLTALFDQLKEKGYKPKATPANSKEPLVLFTIETGSENPLQIDVDERYVVSINYSPNTPNFRAIYENGVFTANNKIVAESEDFLSGLLQIIANKDYIL
jgi:hypothetical protein